MVISVASIVFRDGLEKYEFLVYFEDEPLMPPNSSASVTVFLDPEDLPVSELKTKAIEKARAFLLRAVSAH